MQNIGVFDKLSLVITYKYFLAKLWGFMFRNKRALQYEFILFVSFSE